MDLQPSARQQELIARARWLAQERFAPRAAAHDRDASFPFDDYADLRAEGFLGLCVPERHGGLGASYETYCLVAEQLAQGNASTSLTFNMHCLTMLMMGELADVDGNTVPRHKAFFMLDRTIPVGFTRGANYNVHRAMLVHRIVE